jgi:hypothetical protein
MTRSGYLAAIADPRAGNAGKRRRRTVLSPPRHPYGIEPARPAEEMPAGQLFVGEAPLAHADHPMDSAVPGRTAPLAVPVPPGPGAETPSAFVRPPAQASDTTGPEPASPARPQPSGPHGGRAEADRAVGSLRDTGRPSAGRRAARLDHLAELGSRPAQSAAVDLAEASTARVPPPLGQPIPEPVPDSPAPWALAPPAPEPVRDSAASWKTAPHPALATHAARPGPTVLAPSARAVTDHERTRPWGHEPARRAVREPARVHIGTIDLTVVPPPPPAAPTAPGPPRAARTVPAETPLSRGSGPWFGVGQR